MRAGFSRRLDGTDAPKDFQQTLVRSFDSEGKLAALVIPVAQHEPYHGAPLHVHHDVDEWIFILGGQFVAEVGGKRMRLKTGDSLLMPMKIPHRWSIAEIPISGAIHLYTPAGRMDIAFDDPPRKSATPPTPEQIRADFESCNMTLLGVPLTKKEITQTI
jgi:quercetin dioxygenase-like cupin family protein